MPGRYNFPYAMTARYPGKCLGCLGWFDPGSRIIRASKTVFFHPVCKAKWDETQRTVDAMRMAGRSEDEITEYRNGRGPGTVI
jgi:hypothetical protein